MSGDFSINHMDEKVKPFRFREILTSIIPRVPKYEIPTPA